MIAIQAMSPTNSAVRCMSVRPLGRVRVDYGYSVAENGTTSSQGGCPGDTIDVMAAPARRPQDGAPAPGSAAWWSARRVPPPERGRGRPPRSFETIVSVAADLVDEFGVDGVNMRLLAERLETGTATLYRHVTGKDELMVYVLDSRMGEIVGAYDALAAPPRTWRGGREADALSARRFLVAHPNVL